MASHEQPGAASRGEVAPPPGAEAQPGGGELPSSVWSAWLNGTVSELHSRKLLRSLRPVVPTAVPTEVIVPHATFTAWVDGTLSVGEHVWQTTAAPGLHDGGASAPDAALGVRVRLFSTNDYLGLSSHPAVRAAYAAGSSLAGSGPRASALVAGYTDAHRALEAQLAALKRTQECLLFPTGFAANVSVLQALAGDSQCEVFSDELNHASIVDGCRLAARAGAKVTAFRHSDMAHLQGLLAASGSSPSRKLIVSDTLFSMDGDWAHVAQLRRLADQHGALLVLDDAHATLVSPPGEHGTGQGAHIHVGTLSKAVGALGGFVACSTAVKLLLISRARGQVYSTSLPIPVVAAAQAALGAAASEPARVAALWERVRQLQRLTGLVCASPIVAIHIGDEQQALDAAAGLLRRGFHVPAIRPPTVPPGTARLRVALSAAHSERDVADLAEALRQVGALTPRASKL